MERYFLILALSCASFSVSLGGERDRERNFSVKERENAVELSTPWGSKDIYGDFNPATSSSYYFSIPIKDLKPSKTWSDKDQQKGDEAKNATEDGKMVMGANGILIREQGSKDKDSEWEDIIEDEYEEDPEWNDKSRGPASLPPRVVVEYDDTDKLIVEANRLYNRRHYYEATTVVEEILRKRPDLVRAWVMKGSLLKVQGHVELAQNAYEKALALDPNNKELQSLTGRKP